VPLKEAIFPPMSPRDALPVIPFASRDAWDAWLAEHHEDADGVWIKIAKKASGIESVTHPEALEVALCYGWIDGLRDRLDDEYFLQRFTPRRPRSKWSKINCGKATELIEQGRMRPAGLKEVERAKADGRWDAAYDGPRTATVPDDLQAALDADDGARAFFATLNATNRYAILHRIQDAKRPETRARRIAKYVAMCREGRKIYE
jgi:uncharacterized protein YdeI (YjbR/CyaY-like superfamily)